MKMYLISDNVDTYTGMRLAGVEGVVVHERSELKESLEYAVSDKEIGIILLTEKFGREFPEIIDEVRLHHKTPLIIEIPDRHGTGRKPDFITSMECLSIRWIKRCSAFLNTISMCRDCLSSVGSMMCFLCLTAVTPKCVGKIS